MSALLSFLLGFTLVMFVSFALMTLIWLAYWMFWRLRRR